MQARQRSRDRKIRGVRGLGTESGTAGTAAKVPGTLNGWEVSRGSQLPQNCANAGLVDALSLQLS